MASASLRALVASDFGNGNLQWAGRLVRPERPVSWSLETLAGRIVELDGMGRVAEGGSPDREHPDAHASAVLTAAARLVRDAQAAREPAVWLQDPDAGFFPPDLAAAGVDLDALPVVHVRSTDEALRAADQVLRSGAFGLVVLDLTVMPKADVPMAAQVRMTGLAKQHGTALVHLFGTDRKGFLHPVRGGRSGHGGGAFRSSRGSAAVTPSRLAMASLRASAWRARTDSDRRLRCVVDVHKDKKRGHVWRDEWSCDAPAGLL